MKSLRTMVGFIFAFALAAFAMPAAADNKIYTFVAGGPIPAGSSGKFTLTFTNSADGNSTFNSVQVVGGDGLNTSGFKFTYAKVISGSNKPGNISPLGTSTLRITDLSPIKSTQQGGAPLTIEVEVSTTVNSCGGGSITWTPDAWTGSPGTPSNFFTRPATTPTTVTSTCLLTFVTNPADTNPADARTNQNISNVAYNPTYNPTATPPVLPVQAKLVINGSPVNGKAIDVKLNAACGATLGGKISATTGSDGIAKFDGLQSSTKGTGCVLKAEYRDDTSVSGTSSTSGFKVVDASAVISPTLTSVSTKSGTTLTVKLLDGTNVIPQSGTGTISTSGEGNCTLGSTTTVSSTTGVLEFSGILGTKVGATCKLQVTGNFGGTQYTLATSDLKVFDGVLNCGDPSATIDPTSTLGNQIDASEVDDISEISYYKGARGQLDVTDPKKPTVCVPVNATYVNNIDATNPDGTVTGKTVPPNGAALFWDEVLQPNSTFRVVTTFKDEWTDGNGWLSRRTRLCLDDGCTNRAYLKVCLGTALVAASMPVYVVGDLPDPDGSGPLDASTGPYAYLIGKKMPACIYGEAFTAVVPVAGKGCDSVRPSPNGACIRNTTELLIVGDPAWDR